MQERQGTGEELGRPAPGQLSSKVEGSWESDHEGQISWWLWTDPILTPLSSLQFSRITVECAGGTTTEIGRNWPEQLRLCSRTTCPLPPTPKKTSFNVLVQHVTWSSRVGWFPGPFKSSTSRACTDETPSTLGKFSEPWGNWLEMNPRLLLSLVAYL